MPEHIDQPCKDGLTAACFAQEPVFARRAFSFRLLSAFVPPAMSRKLLTFLGLIRFDPAGNLPDWLNLPPWWILLPGAIIPPGWKFGDPIFDGLFIPPVYGLKGDYSNPYGPWYLTPGGSGPTRPGGFDSYAPPPWFYDGFKTFDTDIWEEYIDGAATISLDGLGSIKLKSTGTDYCLIRTAPDDTIPDKWLLTFRIKIQSYSGVSPNFFLALFSGSRMVKFRLDPPSTISHGYGGDYHEITVDNYVGTYHTFSIKYKDGYTDLFMDGVGISYGQLQTSSSAFKGRISLDNNNEIDTLIDYVSIDEL